MDAFLDKFQSQPYRGGFREDQWEEVGRGGFWGRSLVLAAWSLPKNLWLLVECQKPPASRF